VAEVSAPAPRALLIHGFASDPEQTWVGTGWTAALEEAGREWHAPVLPAHGGGASPADPAAYATPAVIEQLMTGVDDEVLDVVGYSMGGTLALELALSRPRRVRRLVAGGLGAGTPFDAEEAERLLADIVAGRRASPDAVGGLWAMTESRPPEDLAPLAALLVGLARGPRSTDYGKFRGPALLFGGAEDRIVATLPDLAAKLPQAETLLLPRRNHRTALSSGRTRREAIAFLDRP
jgi:pimeloyl-ACP methyl ester carboxylesterase